MDCACSAFNGSDNDDCCGWSERDRKAAKSHKCYECSNEIRLGEHYVFHSLFGEDSIQNFKICYSCQSLIRAFFPDGWVYGRCWDYMRDYLYDNWANDLPSFCIKSLEPAARDRVCDLFEEFWAEEAGYE